MAEMEKFLAYLRTQGLFELQIDHQQAEEHHRFVITASYYPRRILNTLVGFVLLHLRRLRQP